MAAPAGRIRRWLHNERAKQGNERMGQGIHTLVTHIYPARPNRKVIKLQLRGTLRPVRLLVDTGAEVSVIKHECLDIPKCRGKKDHDILVIMGNDKINMLGTSQLEMKNKQVEFLLAKNDCPIDLDGIAGRNFKKNMSQ